MTSIGDEGHRKCPKAYLKGAFVTGGMVIAFVGYLLVTSATGSSVSLDWTAADGSPSAPEQTSLVQAGGAGEASLSPSAFLGVEILTLEPALAEQLAVPGKGGVLMNGVVAGSPADQADLKRGDVIVALGRHTVENVDAFRDAISRLEPGDKVRIVFIRDGRKETTYAELAESAAIQKTAGAMDSGDSGWGASLSAISPAVRESLGIPPQVSGVAVLSVVPGGSADRAGLVAGDVIRGVEGTAISSMGDLFEAVASDTDQTALLDVYGRGRMRYVPMDSSSLKAADQTRTTFRQRIFSIFAAGAPFSTDAGEDDEEGPKGGKFSQDDVQLAADTTGFARPASVPGDANTGGPSGGSTGFSRPSTVPGEANTGGPGSTPGDVVLFIGLLILAILYLGYREYHRPPKMDKDG